jgi:hypothetical protein
MRARRGPRGAMDGGEGTMGRGCGGGECTAIGGTVSTLWTPPSALPHLIVGIKQIEANDATSSSHN